MNTRAPEFVFDAYNGVRRQQDANQMDVLLKILKTMYQRTSNLKISEAFMIIDAVKHVGRADEKHIRYFRTTKGFPSYVSGSDPSMGVLVIPGTVGESDWIKNIELASTRVKPNGPKVCYGSAKILEQYEVLHFYNIYGTDYFSPGKTGISPIEQSWGAKRVFLTMDDTRFSKSTSGETIMFLNIVSLIYLIETVTSQIGQQYTDLQPPYEPAPPKYDPVAGGYAVSPFGGPSLAVDRGIELGETTYLFNRNYCPARILIAGHSAGGGTAQIVQNLFNDISYIRGEVHSTLRYFSVDNFYYNFNDIYFPQVSAITFGSVMAIANDPRNARNLSVITDSNGTLDIIAKSDTFFKSYSIGPGRRRLPANAYASALVAVDNFAGSPTVNLSSGPTKEGFIAPYAIHKISEFGTGVSNVIDKGGNFVQKLFGSKKPKSTTAFIIDTTLTVITFGTVASTGIAAVPSAVASSVASDVAFGLTLHNFDIYVSAISGSSWYKGELRKLFLNLPKPENTYGYLIQTY